MMRRLCFSKFELGLWAASVALIVASFFAFSRDSLLSLISSLVGVTSLILIAKGNPLGQALGIVFSVLYGIISFSCSYYGEMITFLGMNAPMSLLSLIAWLRHPFQGDKTEVEISDLTRRGVCLMSVAALAVTVLFYFVLAALHNANLVPSTLSVTTSFLGAYMMYKRSPFYSLAYLLNDIVLIVLWVLASLEDTAYLSVVVCFIAFMANDIYAFTNWRKMKRKQRNRDRQSP